VSQPKNDSDESVLPHPELNPLLNPLLAAHMGRWAEVYFTSPPEKREQAVADLLRELESNSPPSASSPSPENPSVQRSYETDNDQGGEVAMRGNDAESEASESSPDVLPVLHCSSCGAVNWFGQRFCGMCGAPLPSEAQVHLTQDSEVLPVSTASWTEHGLSPRDSSVNYADERAISPTVTTEHSEGMAPVWRPSENLRSDLPFELPSEHPAAGVLPAFATVSEPVPYRYRAYVGVVLSVLFIILVYFAWRHGSFSSSTVPTQPTPLPSMSAEAPTGTASPEPGATPNIPRQNAATPPTPFAPSRRTDVRPQKTHAAPRATRPAIPAPAAITAEQSGRAELAMAEKYLQGRQGTSRDSREAVQWLWKAVSTLQQRWYSRIYTCEETAYPRAAIRHVCFLTRRPEKAKRPPLLDCAICKVSVASERRMRENALRLRGIDQLPRGILFN
jgi:hypothetical protein